MNRTKKQGLRWHIYPTADDLVHHASQAIDRASQQAIAQRGTFSIVLAGGRTPQRVYSMLRQVETDWGRWHLYFGDERCQPPDHPDRNDTMALTAWLAYVAIPQSRIHRIPAELGPDVGARAYRRALEQVDSFDLVLLGLGEDGHTASLFPDRPAGDEPDAPDVLAVRNAPKPPPARISLSAQRLSRTRQVMFLVTGVSKREAVTAWHQRREIPARHIRPEAGVDLLVEKSCLPAWP